MSHILPRQDIDLLIIVASLQMTFSFMWVRRHRALAAIAMTSENASYVRPVQLKQLF